MTFTMRFDERNPDHMKAYTYLQSVCRKHGSKNQAIIDVLCEKADGNKESSGDVARLTESVDAIKDLLTAHFAGMCSHVPQVSTVLLNNANTDVSEGDVDLDFLCG